MHNVHGVLTRLLPLGCWSRAGQDNTKPSSKEQPTLTPESVLPGFRINDKYTWIKHFDPGEEGECAVVRSKSTSRLFVVKRTKAPESKRGPSIPQSGRRKPLPNEVRMLVRLQGHNNIIRFHDVEACKILEGRHLIYLEFCRGGDLLDQLKAWQKSKTKSPEIFTLHALVGLAYALAFLHHGLKHIEGTNYTHNANHDPILHGDIKPDNILLRWPGRDAGRCLPDVVLADFGMAQVARDALGITGTPGWDAPEVRAAAELRAKDTQAYQGLLPWCGGRIMTTKSDVYQLGLVVYLMVTGRKFVTGANPGLIELPAMYEGCVGLLSFLVWCLQVEAVDRPEMTGRLEEGCLYAVDVMRRRRDAIYARDGPVDKTIWNLSDL